MILMSSRIDILRNHVDEQDKRIEKLEAALRDVTRCLIDGKVDMAAPMLDKLHGHRILGSKSVQTMVEIYHRLKAQMGHPGYSTPSSELEIDSISEEAVALIVRYGGIDGAYHKQWVLDQVLRLLAGEAYEEIIAEGERDGYDWSEGIAP